MIRIFFNQAPPQQQEVVLLDTTPVTLRKKEKILNIWIVKDEAIVGREVKVEGETWTVERLGTTNLPVPWRPR